MPDTDPALKEALSEARERGRMRVADILADPAVLSAEAFCVRLALPLRHLDALIARRAVLALPDGRGGFGFPEAQITATHGPHPRMPDLHAALGDPWTVFRFLSVHHGALDGRTGFEALEAGLGQEAVALAKRWGMDYD